MKINSLRLSALLLASLSTLTAAPLSVTTAVHTKPDLASPAITFLKAGTEPTPATSALATTPAGWMAVELPGPFEGYVENKDLAKSLDVKPNAAIRVGPNVDAGILAIAEAGDKATVTGLRGRWTQISLEKSLVGYIKVGATTAAAAAPAPRQSNPAPRPAAAPAPAASAPTAAAPMGQAVPMVNQGDGGASTLPRQFAGTFVSTRRPLRPRRPYDYALHDDAGRRYAYVDISKLLQTEQIEKYIDRGVVVFGAAKNVPDSEDIVILVETLQLR